MTSLMSRIVRAAGALLLLLLLSVAAPLDAAAQSSGTPIAADLGALAVNVFSCVDAAADPEIVDVAPECPAGGTAPLWIDGAGPTDVQDGGAVSLDAGDHAVSTTAAGPGVTVTIGAGETATITVVLHASAPANVPTTSVKVVVHQCQDKIKSVGDLDALGDFPTKLGRCPAASGYDLTLTDSVQTFALDDAGKDGDGRRFKKVAKGPITLVETTSPDGTVFGTALLDPGNDGADLQTDPANAAATLDLTDVDDVTLHIFDFAAPATDRISIVTHLCGNITAKADFKALPDFAKQLLACPVTMLPADSGPAGLFHADPVDFDYTITDANGDAAPLSGAVFKPEDLCETDIQQDINNDGQISTNLCIDGSRYQFDGVAQGAGVVVTQTTAPAGFRLGAVLIAPGDPGNVGKVDLKKETISFNTSDTGDLTIHVFEFSVPPPVDYGSVQIVNLQCDGTTNQTVVKALDPGQMATQDDLGDASCVAGGADFRITLFSGEPEQAFNTGDSGVATVGNLPATVGTGDTHLVTELSTGEYATFTVAPDETTRVIFLNYQAVDGGAVDASSTSDPTVTDDGAVDGGSDGGVSDESAAPGDGADAVVDGDGLPVTGAGPAPTHRGADSASALALFGALSGAAIVFARRARRRSI